MATSRSSDVHVVRVQSDWNEATLKELLDAYVTSAALRFEAWEKQALVYRDGIDARFKNIQIAVDKAEASQTAHNVEANNWRKDYTKLQTDMARNTDLERLDREFIAYRLEVSRILSSQLGEKVGTREHKEDWKSTAALLVAVGAVAVSILYDRRPPTPVSTPTPQVIYVPAPAGALIPSTPAQQSVPR